MTFMDEEADARPPLVVVSFDIDGTLEVGDPAGPIAIAFVRQLLSLESHRVGSCSDNTVGWQERMWAAHDVVPHFAVVKHRLHHVRSSFEATRYVHIGDRPSDREAAVRGKFEFIDVQTLVDDNGILRADHLMYTVLGVPPSSK